MSIRLKLAIIFLSLALIPALFVGALTFINYQNSMETDQLDELKNIAAFRAEKIENYFIRLKDDIDIIQNTYLVKKNFPGLNHLSRNPGPASGLTEKKALDRLLSKTAAILGLSDILLFNPEGETVYASSSPNDLKRFSTFSSGPQQKAIAEGKNHIVFSDIFLDQFKNNAPAMLVTAPAYDLNNTFTGVIAFEVDIRSIYQLIQDVTGLGATGETLLGKLVDQKVVFLNSLRHEPKAPLTKYINIGEEFGHAIQEASQGKNGSGQWRDYRGKQVIGAWRYLPTLGWGLVAKIDTEEAFADITSIKKLVVIILFMIVVLAGVMALSISRSISQPIKKLADGAKIIGQGNLDYQIGTHLKDEVGELSQSFDKMARDLKALTAARDIERQRLFDVLETLPVYVVLLDKDYGVPFANKFFRVRFGESHGRRCYDYLFNKTEPCENCESYKVLKTNAPHHWEWLGPDNRNYDIYDFPITDVDGSPMIMETGIDVTEQKRAEKEIMAHREHLEELVSERTFELETTNKMLAVLTGRFKILAETANQLLQSKNPQENVNALCRKVMEHLDCHIFVNYFIEEPVHRLHLNACAGLTEQMAKNIEWLDFGQAICGRVAQEGKRIVAEDIQESSDSRADLVRSVGIKAYACHPIIVQDQVLGTLSFGTRSRIKFSEDDLALMKIVTDQVATAMERLRFEEVLQHSEKRLKDIAEKYSTMIDTTSDGIWIHNLKGEILEVNDAYCRMLGYSREEIPHMSISKFGVLESPEEIAEHIQKVVHKGGHDRFESKQRRKNGAVMDVDITALYLDREGGQIVFFVRDITLRKRLVNLFQKKSKEQQTILDSAPVMIFYKDKENHFVRTNKAFEDAMGLSKSELEGKSLFDIYPRERANDFWKDDLEVIKSGQAKRGILEAMETFQGTKLLQTEKVPYFDGQGQVIGVIGFSVDITERYKAEKAIIKSKEEWERTFDSMPDLIAILDNEHRIIRANRAMAKVLGREPEQCVGSRCFDCVHELSCPPNFCPHSQTIIDGKEHVAEVHESRLGGDFLVSTTPLFNAQGQVEGAVHVARNITERKKREEQLQKLTRTLRALSNSAQAMIYAQDEVSYLEKVCQIIVNDCGHTMVWIGFAENDDKKSVRPAAQAGFDDGYMASLNLTWADTERGRGPTGTAIRTGQIMQCKNMELDPHFKPWKDEATKRGFASSLAVPLLEKGRAFGALTIYSGIPDAFSEDEVKLLEELAADVSYGITSIRLRAEQNAAQEILKRDKETVERLVKDRTKELLKTQSELEKAKRLSDIGTLAATVAHELRNPLAAIHMAAFNMNRKSKNVSLNDHFEVIERKINESDQIINNLLFYSRIKPPRYEKVDIHAIVEECLLLSRKQYSREKIRLVKRIDPLQRISFEADPLQLKEVLSNIINNAYEAMVKQEGQITISGQKEEQVLRIIIQDTGEGIAQDDLKNVFDPFFTTKARGTGLGLTVCKQIISLHGGTIEIESQKGQGTIVSVQLPIKEENHA